ncbi:MULTISPECIES: PqqD family protein [Microbacterium]|uniref:PqqD family protein n=1 Tax=uncultured Microbacterium sp. TaxID=191216 RepID=UPI002611F8FA|nr:PqqD family protein [uncultured Microbacterium sp.]
MRIRSEGITWQEIDDELVILDMQTSTYQTTNVAGAVLAKLLVEERSTDELAQALIDKFGIDSETADADVAAFIDQLRDKSLLEE